MTHHRRPTSSPPASPFSSHYESCRPSCPQDERGRRWFLMKTGRKEREERLNTLHFCFALCCYLPLLRLHCVFPFLILRQKRPPNMWFAVNEIILNYKVTECLQNLTSEQSTTSKDRGRHHTDMSGADGGSGLCESAPRPFKWFHYFLNPFWI